MNQLEVPPYTIGVREVATDWWIAGQLVRQYQAAPFAERSYIDLPYACRGKTRTEAIDAYVAAKYSGDVPQSDLTIVDIPRTIQ